MVAEKVAEQATPARFFKGVVRLLTLSGVEYITSEERQQFSMSIGKVAWPFARLSAYAVEFMIYHQIGPGHEFVQERPGPHGTTIHLRKTRTMAEPVPGSIRDVDRFSSRVLNLPARIVRAAGLDELLNVDALRNGAISLVGPRPQLDDTVEDLSAKARIAGMPEARITEWHDLLAIVPRGICGASQTIGRVRTDGTDVEAQAAAMIDCDLRWRDTASFWNDMRNVGAVIPALGSAGLQTAGQQLSRAMPLTSSVDEH